MFNSDDFDDLKGRTQAFTLRIIKLVQSLPKIMEAQEI
jgi:hypothetical protein